MAIETCEGRAHIRSNVVWRSAEQFLFSPTYPPAVVSLVTSVAVHKLGLATISCSWTYASKCFSHATISGQSKDSNLSLVGKNVCSEQSTEIVTIHLIPVSKRCQSEHCASNLLLQIPNPHVSDSNGPHHVCLCLWFPGKGNFTLQQHQSRFCVLTARAPPQICPGNAVMKEKNIQMKLTVVCFQQEFLCICQNKYVSKS